MRTLDALFTCLRETPRRQQTPFGVPDKKIFVRTRLWVTVAKFKVKGEIWGSATQNKQGCGKTNRGLGQICGKRRRHKDETHWNRTKGDKGHSDTRRWKQSRRDWQSDWHRRASDLKREESPFKIKPGSDQTNTNNFKTRLEVQSPLSNRDLGFKWWFQTSVWVLKWGFNNERSFSPYAVR